MKTLKSVFLPIFGGLIIAQLIGTGFVFFSNLNLYETVLAVEKYGYLALPYGKASDSLLSYHAAFFGGLFYTLSIGAGLSLVSWAFCHLWYFIFQRNRFFIAVFFLLWAFLLVAINYNGPTLFPTLFCLLVPLGTLITFYKFRKQQDDFDRRLLIIPVTTMSFLIVFCVVQFDRKIIIKIRDHLLFTNPVGQAASDFYYRYTLHAAQAFISFDQKTLRTYHLHSNLDGNKVRSIKKSLLRLDLLLVPELSQPDLSIIVTNSNIVLHGKHNDRVSGELTDFIKNPTELLKSYSKESDRFESLRLLIFFSFLFGFPSLFFLTIYGLLHIVVDLFVAPRFHGRRGIREITIAFLFLCITIGLYYPLRVSDLVSISDEKIGSALESNDWVKRLAALQIIEHQRLELADYPHYRKIMPNASLVERFWLARALAASKSPQTYLDLLSMIDDIHPNVRCQVFYALGRRGDKKAIEIIKEQIMASDHWYTQWYGYLSLKRLGWHQGQ